MTIFDWIILGIVIAGLLVMAFLFVRKWKRLQLLDLEAMPQAKIRSKKRQLIEERMMRKTKGAGEVVKKVLAPINEMSKKWYHKLLEKERKLRHAKPETENMESKEKTRQKITSMIEKGAQLYKEESYADAETIFLDIVRMNPKEVEAYEYLGEIYLQKKEYDHAIETLEFARQLNPNEDRIYFDLGSVYQSQKMTEKAEENLRKAVELAPKSPRNLNGLLQFAIEKKDVILAKSTLHKLKEANPENGKLEELEKTINEL